MALKPGEGVIRAWGGSRTGLAVGKTVATAHKPASYTGTTMRGSSTKTSQTASKKSSRVLDDIDDDLSMAGLSNGVRRQKENAKKKKKGKRGRTLLSSKKSSPWSPRSLLETKLLRALRLIDRSRKGKLDSVAAEALESGGAASGGGKASSKEAAGSGKGTRRRSS